jgi:RNA polymerase sigma factor (sigma-70 family)
MRPPPFQAFLEEHREPVYRFLRALLGPEEAEDCFQDTFLSALRSYSRLRDGSNLRAWVMTIAHRKALDAHRRRARGAEPVGEVPDRPGRGNPEPPDEEVWRRVRALPSAQRTAVFLRHAGDLAYRDVAKVMGTSEAAARQSVRLGLRRLREEWR